MSNVVEAKAQAFAGEPVAQPVLVAPQRAANEPSTALSVVDYAVRSGASVQQIQALMDLQVRADNHQLELMREKRRMDDEDRRTAARLAFDAALAAFRSKNVVVIKTREVVQKARDGGDGPRFWQAEFDEVCRTLSGPLSECGFGFRHDMKFGTKRWMVDGVENDNPWVYVTCILTHKQGHTEVLELDGPPWEGGTMNGLQRMSASGSFLKRVSVLTITGTPTGGEDDESQRDAASGKAQPRALSGEADAALQDLIEAGQQKAGQGMDALTAWWAALTEQQRKVVTPSFAAMRQAARRADAKKGDGNV